jgi:hypothetical protein
MPLEGMVTGIGDPLHAIDGTPLRTPLLGAFAAGQRGLTTTCSVPLLSSAVPWLMPQPCPGNYRGPWLTDRYRRCGIEGIRVTGELSDS